MCSLDTFIWELPGAQTLRKKSVEKNQLMPIIKTMNQSIFPRDFSNLFICSNKSREAFINLIILQLFEQAISIATHFGMLLIAKNIDNKSPLTV